MVSLLLLSLVSHLDADPLWDEAVSFFSHSDDWTPFQMEMVSRQLAPDGSLKELWEMKFILPPGGEEDDWEMIEAIKDGHPATEKELKKRDSAMQNGPPGGYFEGVDTLVLDPNEAQRVRPVNTGKTVQIDGESCLVYSFTHTYESGAKTAGEVFITQEGFPLQLNYSFTNLPFYMKKMSNRFSFTRKEDTALVETMWMEGKVTFIFLHMNFLTRIAFRDYQVK